eukprot:TRINITY_DN50642_c0_g1_i1.p1 TRINITY_DN50642_c0_g1~~TRINITY_DN50642_c0_g1_i1.p1  ORF type:complete len:294 (+),score=14.41 TRINITY_DN50642_c0_g1_i1:53-883(+)
MFDVHVIFQSLWRNGLVWFLSYAAAYLTWYVLFHRPLSAFKFNPQYPPRRLVTTEFRRCIASVIIACIYDVVVSACYKNGYTLGSEGSTQQLWDRMRDQPLETVTEVASGWRTIAVVLLWSDFHFYWVHRLLHESKWLYRHVHKVHHESHNPDPWSGLSFHPIEAALYLSSTLVVFLLPLTILQSDLLRFGLIVSPIFGHLGHGHESWPWGYDHFIHHAKFNYNFGSGLFPCNGIWDNICGTAYQEGSSATLARQKDALSQAAAAKLTLHEKSCAD